MKCIFELREAGKFDLTLSHTQDSLDAKKLDIGQELLLSAEQQGSYEMVAILLQLGL